MTEIMTYADDTDQPQEISQHIVISRDKSVYVPEIIRKSIVYRDHNIERLTFDCPRYWYGKDISTLNIYVNYISASQKAKGDDPGSSLCENVVIDENDQDMMHFDWVITNNISQDVGGLLFLVCAKSVDSDGNEDVHWNSHLCKDLEVQEGLEASDSIVKKYPDVIEQIFQRLDNVDGVSPEQIAAAVEEYLVGNPPSGMTADEKAQLNKNTEDISLLSEENAELKGDLEQLKQNGTGTGTGLSTEAIDKLEEVGNYLVYTTADGGSKWTELIDILRNGSSGGGSGETVTLQSISATYTGGEVTTGTALSDLTGIVVTATYSDGTTKTVTGYTLSGTIAEGGNTITVSYSGKTATFTVTGVVESGGEEADPLYPLESCNNVTVLDRYNNANKPALLTVDGNDISWVGGTNSNGDTVTSSIWYFNVNCSSAITNGVNGRTAPTWFTIPSGATVELVCSNVSDNWNYNNHIGLNKTGNTDWFTFVVGGKLTTGTVAEEPVRSFTTTVEEDTEINALVIDFSSVTTEVQTVNVKVYVNGERWI